LTLGALGMACWMMLAVTAPTPAPVREIPLGAWGGTGLALTVEESGAKLELDCAHGRITGRLALDSDGRFELPGTITRERPGPVRMGPNGEAAEEKSTPATYSGRLEKGVLKLTIRIEGSRGEPTALEARFGQTPRLRKCL
jgi:hypothetical protein